MDVNEMTYSELNRMFSDLVEEHGDETTFFSEESAEKYADDELINDGYIGVQNAFDILATKVENLKDVFQWSFGIEGNSYDVGLAHIPTTESNEPSLRQDMIKAECMRRGVDYHEFIRIVKEMECVSI